MPAAGLRALARGRPVSLTAFEDVGIARFVRRTLAERPIGAIVVFSGQMAQYVPADRGAACFVMDFVDVDSAKFAAYAETARPPMRWIQAREARLLAAFERETAIRADISLFVSEAEAALFRRRSGLGPERVRALGNGVDLMLFDPAKVAPVAEAGPLIVFTGQMDYAPNIEAVTAFARECLPAIRAAVPRARFAIVGRAPTPAVRALAAQAGVIVTGEVADVRGWLKAADVVVAPLKLARGVQNKVLEAMAMARPVVASPAAFEGIEATAGRDLIVAEGAAAVAAIVRLLSDDTEARLLGEAARARIVSAYSWGQRLAPLARLIGWKEAA